MIPLRGVDDYQQYAVPSVAMKHRSWVRHSSMGRPLMMHAGGVALIALVQMVCTVISGFPPVPLMVSAGVALLKYYCSMDSASSVSQSSHSQ